MRGVLRRRRARTRNGRAMSASRHYDGQMPCAAKVAYALPEQAVAAAYGRARHEMHAYKCDWCGFFHMGHDRLQAARVETGD